MTPDLTLYDSLKTMGPEERDAFIAALRAALSETDGAAVIDRVCALLKEKDPS